MDTFPTAPRKAFPVTVVAIPVKDEQAHIGPCLAALNQQVYPPDSVVLLLNNCSDDSAAIAQALRPDLAFGLHIVCETLPAEQSNAGHARRMAMALAARQAGVDGVLLTTDADTLVPPDWIHRNLSGLLRGADVVCGRVMLEPAEAALIPDHLHEDSRREDHLIGLVDAMAWRIDPDPHDPPPRHTQASGASLAVWVAAFDRAGGIPAIPCGEDRAFVEALRRTDARIRHDPGITVAVSGRLDGRAIGGMADTIRRRMIRQDEFADVQVEPAENAMRRLLLRRRTRTAWSGRVPDRFLSADLAIDAAHLAQALRAPFFGGAWAAIEAISPALHRVPVRFADLAAEIDIASRLIDGLSQSEAMAAE